MLQLNDITEQVRAGACYSFYVYIFIKIHITYLYVIEQTKERMAAFKKSRSTAESESEFHDSFGVCVCEREREREREREQRERERERERERVPQLGQCAATACAPGDPALRGREAERRETSERAADSSRRPRCLHAARRECHLARRPPCVCVCV